MSLLVDSVRGRLSAALLLLYYIQGNYAAIYDKPLFDAPLCAAEGERSAALRKSIIII